jgi:hypothetical protein
LALEVEAVMVVLMLPMAAIHQSPQLRQPLVAVAVVDIELIQMRQVVAQVVVAQDLEVEMELLVKVIGVETLPMLMILCVALVVVALVKLVDQEVPIQLARVAMDYRAQSLAQLFGELVAVAVLILKIMALVRKAVKAVAVLAVERMAAVMMKMDSLVKMALVAVAVVQIMTTPQVELQKVEMVL